MSLTMPTPARGPPPLLPELGLFGVRTVVLRPFHAQTATYSRTPAALGLQATCLTAR